MPKVSMALLTAALLMAAPAAAQKTSPSQRPEFFKLGSEEFSWWNAEAVVLVDWDATPKMKGLECRAASTREGFMRVAVRHPVESANFDYSILFELPDETGSINRKVETIGVGGRTYQLKGIQARIVPWFGVHGPNDIILTYGLGRQMVRPNDEYGWYPAEFLLPQFFEAEEVLLGTSGDFEITHGNYEKRYKELRVDLDGFKEAMKWCYEQVNPGTPPKFSAELQSAIGK